uniref:Uncharacterized protein n=1 Tax=Schizaphis graminum TaxID=13262 RepID=A0A2S2PJY9_SCHGA
MKMELCDRIGLCYDHQYLNSWKFTKKMRVGHVVQVSLHNNSIITLWRFSVYWIFHLSTTFYRFFHAVARLDGSSHLPRTDTYNGEITISPTVHDGHLSHP